MARKKEFKPDQKGTPFLKRLYLTPRQRKTLLKWVLYSVMLVALSLLQDVVFCRLNIFGATTDLVPCGIILVCLLEGAESGSVFALIASTLYLFSGTAPGAYCILFITLPAVLVSVFRQAYLRVGFSAAMLCGGVSVMVYELLVFAAGAFLGLTGGSRFGVFALTGVLSMAVLPALYPVFVAIGRIGGQGWKE